MPAQAWISEITFKNGTVTKVNRDDIVVFVRPNNAGKSSALKELFELLAHQSNAYRIIDKILIEREGTFYELINFVISRFPANVANGVYFLGYNFNFSKDAINI